MNSKITEKEWLEDFKDFMEAKDAVVPADVSKNIFTKIHKALNPSPWLVFYKIFIIHVVVGTLSLAVCSQFGMNPFHTNFSLSEYFMRVSHSFCMTLCGFIFLSFSVLFAWLSLKPEEFKVFCKNSYIQVFSLSILSLVTFTAFGAEVVLSVGIFWLIGALAGGLVPAIILRKNRFA